MLQTNFNYILSCDIGGTHITSSIVCQQNWEILDHTITRSSVKSYSDAKTIFQTWANNIKECIAKSNESLSAIGIAMPGPFDYENGISLMIGQSKYDAIYKLNTTVGIQEELKNSGVLIKYINDAAAFLQGEVYGSKREQENIILGITLGTGLGSAVKEKNKKAFDADLWNTPYKESIFEEYLVTRWFTKRFFELKGVKEIGLKEIIENHQDKPEFNQLLEEYRNHLKDFLDFFSSKYNSKSFILGGNIAKAWSIINNNDLFNNYDIKISQYAEKAALIGAASIF